LFIVGGAIIAYKLTFTPRVGLSMELTVAAMLIVLGLLNLLDMRPDATRVNTAKPFIVGVRLLRFTHHCRQSSSRSAHSRGSRIFAPKPNADTEPSRDS